MCGRPTHSSGCRPARARAAAPDALSSPPMRIRDATPDDAAVIARFNSQLALESEGRCPDPSVLRHGVERGLARPDMCRYWLAQDTHGEIIGQSMVTYEWSDWRDGMFWWLQSVYVVPEARGQGVFRALYQHIANLAQTDPDGRGLRLYVETENSDAHSVYARLGMRGTGYLVLEDDWSEAFGAKAD